MDSANTLLYVARLIRRNFISVLAPTLTVLSIYADLRHTARWKRQLVEDKAKQ